MPMTVAEIRAVVDQCSEAELAPMLDISGVSTATACKVLRELLIALDKGWPGFQV